MSKWSEFGFPTCYMYPYLYPFKAIFSAQAERIGYNNAPIEEIDDYSLYELEKMPKDVYLSTGYYRHPFYNFFRLPFTSYFNHIEYKRNGAIRPWSLDDMVSELSARGFEIPFGKNIPDVRMEVVSYKHLIGYYVAINLLKYRYATSLQHPHCIVEKGGGYLTLPTYDSIEDAINALGDDYDKYMSLKTTYLSGTNQDVILEVGRLWDYHVERFAPMSIKLSDSWSGFGYGDQNAIVNVIIYVSRPKHPNHSDGDPIFDLLDSGFVEGFNEFSLKRGEEKILATRSGQIRAAKKAYLAMYDSRPQEYYYGGYYLATLPGAMEWSFYKPFFWAYVDLSSYFQYYDDCDNVTAADFGL